MPADEKDMEKQERVSTSSNAESGTKDQDAEFGGPEARKKLERRFLWKLDLRMSIMVVIYILNYVRLLTLILYHSFGRSADLLLCTFQIDRNNAGYVLSQQSTCMRLNVRRQCRTFAGI
jgi:hypothetical protein